MVRIRYQVVGLDTIRAVPRSHGKRKNLGGRIDSLRLSMTRAGGNTQRRWTSAKARPEDNFTNLHILLSHWRVLIGFPVLRRGQAMYGELAYGEKGKKSSANPDKCQALEGIYDHQVTLCTACLVLASLV